MTSKNGASPNGVLPDYIEEAVLGFITEGKVTLAPGTSRETTFILEPHVGDKGREKDTKLLEHLDRMRKATEAEEISETEFLVKNQEELYRMSAMALDRPVEELKHNFTLFELASGFMKAMRYRSGESANDAVQAAIKKYKAELEKAEGEPVLPSK